MYNKGIMRKWHLIIGSIVLLNLLGATLIQGCRNKSSRQKKESAAPTVFQFKEKLSDYHFFTGRLHELNAQPELISYDLRTPLFTDYAIKDRFILLPRLKPVEYRPAGILEFPDSTIIIKNFSYRNTAGEKIMIETRLLVKDPGDHKWKVMNYRWKQDQSDAVKLITGDRVPVTLTDDENNRITTVYQVPNTNDCKRCHVNNDILAPIGLKARNLNFVRSGQMVNQLVQWAKQGILSGLPAITTVEAIPDWKDSLHFSLEQRARAYLDINCAHCHIKGGDAYNTGLFLEYQQNVPDKLGILKAPVSAGGGAGGLDYDIVPGDAAHSVMAYRMSSTETGTAMPELARTVIHKEGVRLIINWINSLPKVKK